MKGRTVLPFFLLVGLASGQSQDAPDPYPHSTALTSPDIHYGIAVEAALDATAKSGNMALADEPDVDITVKLAGEPHGSPAGVLVSVSDLKVPMKAAKEFSDASRFIAKQDWKKALERLRKVVAIAPDYPPGYNNLAVVYSHTGNMAEAEKALRTAIERENRFGPAYVNLARLRIVADDYRGAETFLERAMTLPSPDGVTLYLLAYVQYMNEHFDRAIETCRQGHEKLPFQHGFLHLVAAHAYAETRRTPSAIAELRFYLSEEPNGARATEVRQSIARLLTMPDGTATP